MEEQLDLVTSSGRPFELIDVRVVGEDGTDVAKDSLQVSCSLHAAWWESSGPGVLFHCLLLHLTHQCPWHVR